MTLRNYETEAIAYLKSKSNIINCPADDITAGKYGELPSVSPQIWVYAEPVKSNPDESTSASKGIIEIWACCQGNDRQDSKFLSIEMCERMSRLFDKCKTIRFQSSNVEFDGYSGQIAISVLTLEIVYQYSELE